MKINHWTVLSVEAEDGYAPELRSVRIFSGKYAEKNAKDCFKRWVADLEGIKMDKMDMDEEEVLEEATLERTYEGQEDFRHVRVEVLDTSVGVRMRG